jgi:glycosyltransferase involved in cell wall biosynthesis
VSPDRPVAYILGRFPQASQTFIAREIRGLRELGVPLLIFALGSLPPTGMDERDRRWYGEIRFTPFVLGWSAIGANFRFLTKAPRTYLRTLRTVLALPHRPRVLTLRALALMIVGGWIAREIERAGGCRQVHAHFALAQTEVAIVVAGLLGRPYSFTAHARDIYAAPTALEEKIRGASLVVTCTQYNLDHLRRLCPDVPADRIRLVHHGVDLPSGPVPREPALQTALRQPPLVVAAGRLIEKKGFDTLIRACSVLRQRGVHFRCRIFGTGSLEGRLRRQIAAAGLGAEIEMPGWRSNAELLETFASASVFAMPSRISDGGDRDGIPNVVLEAMSVGLPVVASEVSGIPEVVDHGKTGVLIPPDDAAALADALARILADPGTAARMGAAGRERIHAEFSIRASSERLAPLFGFSFQA